MRHSARVLPVNPDDRVLLLHGWDPARPDEPYWFTIGGGVEDGETLAAAARRELFEEVGLDLAVDALGEPVAVNTVDFSWGGRRLVHRQTYFAVAVDDPPISFAGQDPMEQATIDAHGWWTAEDLEASGLAANPAIPGLIKRAVAHLRRA